MRIRIYILRISGNLRFSWAFLARPSALFLFRGPLAVDRILLVLLMMLPTGNTIAVPLAARTFTGAVRAPGHAEHRRIADAVRCLLRVCLAKAQTPVNLHRIGRGIYRHLSCVILPTGAEKQLPSHALPVVCAAHKEQCDMRAAAAGGQNAGERVSIKSAVDAQLSKVVRVVYRGVKRLSALGA